MKEGLVPATGRNNYKSMEDYVYLSSEKDLAPWLSILKHVDDPVIIEVDAKQLTGIEQGRVFTTDREFTPHGYSEYRTQNVIPPSALMAKDLGRNDEFSQRLCDNMLEQLNCVNPDNRQEWQEVMTGMDRLEQMGVISSEQKKGWVEISRNATAQAPNVSDEGLPRDENDNGKTPAWDDGDAFAKALGTLPEEGKQMTLADYGMKI